MENSTGQKYLRAKEKVEEIKGFYGNLLAYAIVIPILGYINYNTTGFPWVVFPALGWGFGVVFHGLNVFGRNPIFGREWEERKIQELMNNDQF